MANEIAPRESRIEERVFSKPMYYRDVDAALQVGQKEILLTDANALKNQIYNILGTLIGSEWFEPTYGSNLPYRVFDPMTDITSALIKHDTIDAIDTWMQGNVIVDRNAAYIDADVENDTYHIQVPFQSVKGHIVGTFNFRIYHSRTA